MRESCRWTRVGGFERINAPGPLADLVGGSVGCDGQYLFIADARSKRRPSDPYDAGTLPWTHSRIPGRSQHFAAQDNVQNRLLVRQEQLGCSWDLDDVRGNVTLIGAYVRCPFRRGLLHRIWDATLQIDQLVAELKLRRPPSYLN